ncbi:NADH-quinone oxidoreductase subunit M [Candidatus Magnetaquicoccus inordinatus]|uniref:complex I subunit 4 family protein n=1 Tax=Candidatus Magnetaquicoccus inordinatus TaxID=2496818 RepID=UPI00102AA630
MLFLPFLGAIVIGLLPARHAGHSRRVALFCSGLVWLLAWSLLAVYDPSSSAVQALERHPWATQSGGAFLLGIDGFSLPMLLLATSLAFVALLASHVIHDQLKGYYLFMLLLELGMLGVFMAQDWSLFYIFWEFTLIPLFFLINRWGGARRQHAALNFVLYTMGGSVFLLISLLLAFDAAQADTFAMSAMAGGLQKLPAQSQLLIFFGFLLGFGVKMPIFPIHGWLPLAHVEAPSPVSIILSGVLLKMGSYGLIRAAAILPVAMLILQPLLLSLGMISLLYGALLAWRQSDLKAMVAYSSVSHMGVVLLGIATLNHAGVLGAVSQMVAHGLAAAALFLLVGLLYHRTHSREIADYGSLLHVAPRFAVFIALAFVAAIGMPGTVGFIAEWHVLLGGFQQWGGWIALVSGGMLISAAYSVRTVNQLCTGSANARMSALVDLTVPESITAAFLLFWILLLGWFASPMLHLSVQSVDHFVHLFVGVGR